ncbi:MAG TPA: DUF1343 domain-containing protein [Flavilitoribacter sp.]|nr:DUF1343 domain-containing protein [Flavilitoribacter sp.]HMQ90887.1 DUF1343 domain-containing protein [Flavilitoribacter sp.]
METQPSVGGSLLTGAERMEEYLPLLEGKKVSLVVNQTSMVGNTHLVDTLLALGIRINAVFSPEHGFRGEADAGQQIADSRDPGTGIQLVSLYGAKHKPAPEDLKGTDLLIFDIQDVGVRFYTYISTLHFVMEAGAENHIPVMVLDRPNPNGHYVDGPMLDTAYRSFVAMDPVPVVYGLTIGEYAHMVNGESWLAGGEKCDLTVIPCLNYTHQTAYELPVKPSPNLPNMRSVYLYPSTCFFEGTTVSEGRGTSQQFQVYGHPDFKGGNHIFLPQSKPGAMNPKHKGQLCYGYDLTRLDPDSIRAEKKINLHYLVDYYREFPDKDKFFLPSNYIDKLAGGTALREQILAGRSADEIRASWQKDLEAYKAVRKKYLLYPEN